MAKFTVRLGNYHITKDSFFDAANLAADLMDEGTEEDYIDGEWIRVPIKTVRIIIERDEENPATNANQ